MPRRHEKSQKEQKKTSYVNQAFVRVIVATRFRFDSTQIKQKMFGSRLVGRPIRL